MKKIEEIINVALPFLVALLMIVIVVSTIKDIFSGPQVREVKVVNFPQPSVCDPTKIEK